MQKNSYQLIDWFALSADLNSEELWRKWAMNSDQLLGENYPKSEMIPMMQARRMSIPTRLACETFLTLNLRHSIDAAIFVSEHGELERSYKVLDSMIAEAEVSPTDFSMSVHNCAAGLSTILAKKQIEISSVSGGINSFHEAFFELDVLFGNGAKNVLLLDFNGEIPDFYQEYNIANQLAYSAGFLFQRGESLSFQTEYVGENENKEAKSRSLPQSLAFLAAYLREETQFTIKGDKRRWHWEIKP